MSASGGPRWRRPAALLLALAAGTSGLAGCEYADDVGLAPAAVSPSAAAHRDAPPADRDAPPADRGNRPATDYLRMLHNSVVDYLDTDPESEIKLP